MTLFDKIKSQSNWGKPGMMDSTLIADVAAGGMNSAAALSMAPPQGPMTSERVHEAMAILQEYQTGKTALDNRIVENEKWWKRRHWEFIRAKQNKIGEVEPASAWLFNNLVNKHADLMDNYPDANILPREEGDVPEAKILTSVIPVVMERNEWEQTYSDSGWYFLKNGTVPIGVFWDPDKENGLGEICIKKLDLLNLFWQPGITNIQDSPNFFIVSSMHEAAFKSQFPWAENAQTSFKVLEYAHDESIDKIKQRVIIDWYYKIRVNGKTILHYVKFIGSVVLYASENDPMYAERGFYDHGRYPVEFDVLYPEEDSPCGFGMVDIAKEPQLYIDKLDSIIMKNAMMAGKKRFLVRDDGGVNEEELLDWGKDVVHTSGSLDEKNFRELTVDTLDAFIIQHRQSKIDEQKETTANRDFSQGGVTGGVTAASAIAALQESGNKGSRDIVKGRYRTYKRLVHLVIELDRQFYDEARKFRITGEGGVEQFIAHSNAKIRQQQLAPAYEGAEPAYRLPVFDIKVVPQRANPFSRAAQNELAMALYQQGAFNPDRVDAALILLNLLDMEGKDAVIQKVTQNGQAFMILNQLIMMMQGAQSGQPGQQQGKQQKQEATA